MDFYQLLRISSTASQKDIDEAYKRITKEAQYDATIDKVLVESAYRILSNPKQRSAYDSVKVKREQGTAAYTATIKRRRKARIKWDVKKLFALAGIMLVIASVYYVFRFGHVFKSFDVGDVVYMSDTHERVGVIEKVEDEHNFGKVHEAGYLIHGRTGSAWYPAAEVKLRCYKISP